MFKKTILCLGLLCQVVLADLKVGVTAGPHAMILEFVKEQAAKEGLKIDIVEFNDFILPNMALNDGQLQVNSYQHQPFLDEQVKSRGYKIITLGKTVLMPLGAYSNKHKKVEDIQEGAKIAIPNDPTNGSRALLLLQKMGFIKIKDVAIPSILDITENTKKINIIELEAPQVPRSLDDVDMAIINTDFVMLSGLDPKTAIAHESTDSPYVNIIAVRTGDESKKDIQDFLRIYQSDATKAFIEATFKGAIIVGW